MLTEPFLLQSARNHSLTSKQEKVFILKILQNLPYQEISQQLSISEAACLKRMGEVYDKFGIKGRGRGKEQRLRKALLEQTTQTQAVVPDALPAQMSQQFVGAFSSQAVSITTIPTLSGHQAWIQSLQDWFTCLGYQFEPLTEGEPGHAEAVTCETHTEWVVKVRARRGWDKIVIHAVQGEAQLPHVRTIHRSVHQHSAVEGWVIAPRRISSSARREVDLPNSNLFCYTFDELIDQEVNFDNYFDWLEETIEEKEIADKYMQLACKKAEFVPNAKEAIAYSHYGEKEGWIDGYIDLWLDDPVKEHISVLGEFGTGKTWFTLHYAWQMLQRYKLAKQRGTERPRLPLLIPLRDCAKAATLESLVSEYFFRRYQISLPDYKVFEQLNRMGKLLLIFDGFDEMAAKVDRQSMINNFWQLAKVVVPGSKVVLTCRTEHFPDAKAGRELLNAELKASTAGIKAESPQFEVLELEQLSDRQIEQVISTAASPDVAQRFLDHPDLSEIARRPLMLELILDALPAISSGKAIDLARIYLYTISTKLEEDISAERTFTSLADKLYFLCELSWEMLSTEQMSLSYKRFPDRIRQFFGEAVKANADLDHWHYDMMGQTMLIRNERGEYSPVHRSFLEFFVAFKLVAQLGCLAPDFLSLAQQQSHVDNTQAPQNYKWSDYFHRKVNRAKKIILIAPLKAFVQEGRSQLTKTLGQATLSKALLDLMLPMMVAPKESKDPVIQRLLNLLLSINPTEDVTGHLSGNLINLLLQLSPSALQGQDLSHRVIKGADFTEASLRDLNFTQARLEDCSFSQGWSGDLSVVYSPDERFLAVVDSTGEISLRNAKTSEQVWQKKGHTDWIRGLAFDAKSQTLATGSHDQSIKLWDVQTGELIKTIETGSRVYSLIFSQDYDLLASSGDSLEIQLWDVRTGECQQTLKGHKSWIGAVVFGRNNNGEVLASGSNDGEIRLWEIETGTCFQVIQGSDRSIQALSFDALSHKLASGSTDKLVKLWNIETGECSHQLSGHRDWVRTVSLSTGGRLLASGSDDRTIKLWNTETGECFKTIEAHKTRVWSVAFSQDHKTLVSGSDDRTIKLWDLRTGQCKKTLWGSSRGVWSIAFSADAKTIYCGSDDHRIQLWDVQTAQNLPSLSGHKGRVRTISLADSANLLASGSDDKTVKLWNKTTGECLQTLKEHSDWVWSVEFSADGKLLASGSLDHTVILWDTQTKKHLKTLTGHTQFVWSVVWSPSEPILASGSADKTVRLWEPNEGRCLKVLEGHQHQIASLAFSPTGHRLASVSDDGEIKVWDIKTGHCLLTVDDGSRLRTVAWSPDGQYLAVAGLDKVVKLRNAETGRHIREITTHREPVLSLAFNPDGKILASGGEAGIIHLSQVKNSQSLKNLEVDNPYKGLNVSHVTGVSRSQRETLLSLGAFDESD